MEHYIVRFLNSVLSQTYHPIELILINDGSTDNTEQIIKSYIPLFEEKSIIVKYVYRENGGLAAAINTGLQIFTGDYLIWPDSDDFMCSDLIEKMVDFLINNSKYGLVRTNTNVFTEEGSILKPSGTFVSTHDANRFKEDLFDVMILEQPGCWFVPGSYMVRSDIFLKANPSKYIYPCRRGQNWQMLLPVMYISKCGYIDEALHNYIVRKNSMSRTDFTIKDHLYRYNEHEDILLNTIKTIKGLDISAYTKLIKNKYHLARLNLSYCFKDKNLQKQYFEICKNKGLIDSRDYLLYYFFRIIPFAVFFMKAYNRIKSLCKKIITHE
jgi:glycosyltransferase involved in cell wall biosynthesis